MQNPQILSDVNHHPLKYQLANCEDTRTMQAQAANRNLLGEKETRGKGSMPRASRSSPALGCVTFDWIWIATPEHPEAICSCLRRMRKRAAAPVA